MEAIIGTARTHAILTLAERDIENIWKHSVSITDTEKLPIVALDWSELQSYATGKAPMAAAVPVKWRPNLPSLHYSALAFLLHRLPCRLLLLPPYVDEMRNFLDRLRFRGPLGIMAAKSMPDSIRQQLAARLRALSNTSSQLKKLLAGEDITDPLDSKVRKLLQDTLEKHLPAVFLDLQLSTLQPIKAILDLLAVTHEGKRRVVTLKDLDSKLVPLSGTATKHWDYWYAQMARERPNAPITNQSDAVGLAYLEFLHKYYFWHHQVELYFASRSPAMLRIMHRHPGSFPAYSSLSVDELEYDISSARTWEYFAEVGYHMAQSFRKADLELLALRKLFFRWQLSQHLRLPHQPQHRARSPISLQVRDAVERWENVRGAYDLQGTGHLAHWDTLTSNRDKLLINFVRLLLSGNRSNVLLEKAEHIADEAHSHVSRIYDILGLRNDSGQVHKKGNAALATYYLAVTSLFASSTIVLNIPEVLARYYVGQDTDQIQRLIMLVLQNNIEAKAEAEAEAEDILKSNAMADDAGKRLERHWTTGFSLFVLQQYDRVPYHFESWLARNEKAEPSLILITLSLIADSYRHQRLDRDAVDTFDRCDVYKDKFDKKQFLLFLNLRAVLITRIIEDRGEKRGEFSHEPEQCARSLLQELDDEAIKPILTGDPKLYAWCINNFLYLFSRCIEADQANKEDRKWVSNNLACSVRIYGQLKTLCEYQKQARYFHTLGYFCVKRYLYKWSSGEDKPEIFDEGEMWFSKGLEAADSINDTDTKNLILKHRKLAEDHVMEDVPL